MKNTAAIQTKPEIGRAPVLVDHPKPREEAETRSLITRSAAIAMAGGLLSQGLKFLAIIYVARSFSVEQFGLISFAMAVNAYMFVVSNFGLNLFGSREVAQSGSVSGALLAEVCYLQTVLALLGTAVALSILGLVPGISRMELQLIAWFGLSNIIQAGFFDWAFQGLHRQGVSAALNILWQAGWLALTVAAIKFGLGAISVPAAFCASALLAAATGWAWLRRANWKPPREQSFLMQRSWQTLRFAAPLGWSTMLITGLAWADLIVVRLARGEYAAAIYAAAERPALAAGLLLNFYLQGALPGLCRARQEGRSAFGRCFQRAYDDAALVFVPGAIWSAFYGHEIVRALFQKSEYDAATPLFQIFQVTLPLMVFTFVLGNGALLPWNQDRAYQIVLLMTVGAFLVLCPLSAHWWGAMGAALAKVVGYLVASILFYLASRRWVAPNHRKALLAPCVVGVVTGTLSRMLHFSLLPGTMVLLVGMAGLLVLRKRREAWAEEPGVVA